MLRRVWYRVRDLGAGPGLLHQALLGFWRRRSSTGTTAGSQLERGENADRARPRASPTGRRASRRSTSDDVKAEARATARGRASRSGRCSSCRDRCGSSDVFDPDGNRIQLAQPPWSEDCDPPRLARRRPVHALDAGARVPLARRVGASSRRTSRSRATSTTGARGVRRRTRRDRSRAQPRRARPGSAPSAPTSPGYGFVDERAPELTIAVVPSRRRARSSEARSCWTRCSRQRAGRAATRRCRSRSRRTRRRSRFWRAQRLHAGGRVRRELVMKRDL